MKLGPEGGVFPDVRAVVNRKLFQLVFEHGHLLSHGLQVTFAHLVANIFVVLLRQNQNVTCQAPIGSCRAMAPLSMLNTPWPLQHPGCQISPAFFALGTMSPQITSISAIIQQNKQTYSYINYPGSGRDSLKMHTLLIIGVVVIHRISVALDIAIGQCPSPWRHGHGSEARPACWLHNNPGWHSLLK